MDHIENDWRLLSCPQQFEKSDNRKANQHKTNTLFKKRVNVAAAFDSTKTKRHTNHRVLVTLKRHSHICYLTVGQLRTVFHSCHKPYLTLVSTIQLTLQ
jgi:hypothetical protein